MMKNFDKYQSNRQLGMGNMIAMETTGGAWG
jgi:hypothetical protein